ncbi:MAG: hypothetical protein [Bacteriophage sp.]|nr:MAG: hypothetical protein [Bacteriophage sp.]
MGTISDKLMRIINTKEDIRQALISKGYDVPTSIPFKEYAKMILDLPCKVDSFPDIEGIVARYSASGLTNEQMAANPVWVDKTGNGHDLQLKNFAWKGMSGVGGYGDENHQTFYKFTLDDYVFIASPPGAKHMNFTFRVTGLQPGNKLTLAFFGTTNTVYGTWNKDGIYTVDADIVEAGKPTYFYNGYGATRGEFTIEILPLYPGALVFDGVDDYGTCDNFPILTKEKGYTVVVLRQWDQDFLNTTLTGGLLSTRNYSTGEGVAFEKIESSNKGYWNLSAGGIIDFAKSPFTWQTSKQYNNVGILKGDKNHGKPLCVGCGLSGGQQCGRFAIWELVFLDHDATEEELTKIKDYFVKTYPWLFPDKAWTVTGKTNEDEDRATIANITGNGNDLVLSNFGFAEGSGYNEEGEYAGYLVTDGVDDKIISSIFKMGNDWTVIGDWELINTGKNDNAGIVKFDSIVIYNYNSMLINIKNGRNILIPDQNTVNAICSDGRIYSKDWKESIYNEETESTSKNFLTIGYSGNAYTKIAFKNLAIYPTVLSREDCIKAYNYLQTLKAK